MPDDLSTHPVISRQEAIIRGLKRYFTGKPCKHGHIAERSINSGCIECLRIKNYSKSARLARWVWVLLNPDKRAVINARYKKRHRKKVNERNRDWARRNPERHRTNKARSRQNTLAKCREREARWALENPERKLEAWHQRRATKLRIPWADRKALRKIIKDCPEGMVVDHIVPLSPKAKTIEGYSIVGLHVPWNLQYITSLENSRKGNRMRSEDQTLCEG